MKHYFFLVFLPIIGCTNPSKGEGYSGVIDINGYAEVSFDQFIDIVPELDLPLQFDCFKVFESVEGTDKFHEFIPNGATVSAKVSLENHIVILYLFPCDVTQCPTFYSYDQHGKRIDSLHLYNGHCVGDPWIESGCWTVIEENLKITMIDTTQHFFYNDTIRCLDSIRLTTDMYKFKADGTFENTNNKVKRME